MKKGNRPTDGGGNWMDTYGDMVTLLLTFFVMLYSMSSISEQKWEIFVRSIYPDDMKVEQEEIDVGGIIDPNAETDGMKPDELTAETPDLDTLYLIIAEHMEASGAEGVTISRGDGYTFVSFNDNVFFNGNESAITESGRKILADFCAAIDPVSDQLSQLNIMAHTAQGDPSRLNNPRVDRMLSAMRGAEVCTFIQEKNVIEPEKLINISYGQFRPVASNDTSEGRAKNRRVEMLLLDEGAGERSISEYIEEYNSGKNADRTVVTGSQKGNADSGFTQTEASPENVASVMPPSGAEASAGAEVSADTEAPAGAEAPVDTEVPAGAEAPADTEAPAGTVVPADAETSE